MGRKSRGVVEPEAGARGQVPPGVVARMYLVVLGLGLILAAWHAWDLTKHVEEFGMASDSFGYLQMAQDIRAGHAPGGGQKFTADSAVARELIAYFQQRGVPAEKWESMVAPAAYHYEQRSGKIINQYPPGVPLMLALFPAGRALAAWYHIVLVGLLASGAAVLVWGERRFAKSGEMVALLPAAILVLGLQVALLLLGTTVSYSVDFLVLTLLPAAWMTYMASGGSTGRARLWALGAGLLLGYAVLMRVSAVLFVPGFVVCLWPRSWKRLLAEPVVMLAAGVLVAGALPLMVHQASLTGSFWASTYARADTSPPTLAAVGENIPHYFSGVGSFSNWALWTAVATIGLALAAVWRRGVWTREVKRWLGGAAVVWGVPTAYFLTHAIRTPYYQLPTTLVFLLLLGFGAAHVRGIGAGKEDAWAGARGKWVLAALLLAAGVHMAVAVTTSGPPYDPNPEEADVLALPEVLKDPRVGLMADRFSGTWWQLYGIHAISPLRGDAATRRMLYRRLYETGTPTYVMPDDPDMGGLAKSEIEPLVIGKGSEHGSMVPVGSWKRDREVPIYIFKIVWPKGGPAE